MSCILRFSRVKKFPKIVKFGVIWSIFSPFLKKVPNKDISPVD